MAIAGSSLRLNPPRPSEAVYYGLAGDLVRLIEPHSEADPFAILAQFMIAFGSAVGRNPHFKVEADRHGTNLFAAFVGDTAKSRKGMSWNQARRLVALADPQWPQRISFGLSSGEGLIWPVRDPMSLFVNGKTVDDPGVSDKRLLVHESEFGGALRVLSREGNTLSAVMRNAWDGSDLGILTKNNPARATGAHISIIGHVTREELLRYLSSNDTANGFGNRFCWFWTQRSKLLPDGGLHPEDALKPIVERVRAALHFGRSVGELKRDELAHAIWRDVYPILAEGKAGLLGAITARAEPMVMRFALLYALLDHSPLICAPHLQAGLGLWEYAEASAAYIFEDYVGGSDAIKILTALASKPAGLTRTEIAALFSNNRKRTQLDATLAELIESDRIRYEKAETGGRPVERWFAI